MIDIQVTINSKIAAGLIPVSTNGSRKVWVGQGNGQHCDACDEPITAADREYEVDLPSRRTLRFHATCFTAWRDAHG